MVEAAEVLIAATAVREAIVQGDWLRPGQHITAVGADDKSAPETKDSALTLARRDVRVHRSEQHGCSESRLLSLRRAHAL